MSGEGSKFLTDFCVCGGAFKVTSHTPTERELAEDLLTRWQAAHVGDGHGHATPHEANQVRNFWRTRPMYYGHYEVKT